MTDLEIYYYLKRMDEDLQDELKPRLKSYVNLDSKVPVNGSVSSGVQVGLIHGSQRNNADLRTQIETLDFKLIIFLIQGAGNPKEAGEHYQAGFSNVSMIWECGTEYLIEHFEKLENYLKTNPLSAWSLKGWVAKDLQWLAALAIICQGYLIIQAESDEGENNQEWLAVYQQFNEMNQMSELTLSALRRDLNSKKERVCQAKWWLEGLNLWDERKQEICLDKWREFECEITEEWEAIANEPLPKELCQLLTTLQSNSTVHKYPHIVMNAYAAIATLVMNH